MGEKIEVPGHFKIAFETLKKLETFLPVYRNREDILFLRPEQPRPAVSFDWNGEVWLRVDPATGEFVGLEIENFESVFLKKHPELALTWRDAKPLCVRRATRRRDGDVCESFVRVILQFLNDIFKNNPQQIALNPA